MKKTIRDNVEWILERYVKARDDDKFLILTYWYKFDNVSITKDSISVHDFMTKATIPESIRRARQLIQADREDLQPSLNVKDKRRSRKAMMETALSHGQVV